MIIIEINGKPINTPAKYPLAVPTRALAEAIETEWAANKKFVASQMPLTALACTAIDRIEPQKDAVVEALMTYIDTDTLSYRSTGSKILADRQSEQWDPLLSWMSKRFGAIWQVTTGIMPLEQPQDMHEGIRTLLAGKNAMELSALSVMASVFSSLVLALAVLEKQVDAKRAFELSRLEEESQAEAWGRDEEAEERAARMQAEIIACARFLRLLEAENKA